MNDFEKNEITERVVKKISQKTYGGKIEGVSDEQFDEAVKLMPSVKNELRFLGLEVGDVPCGDILKLIQLEMKREQKCETCGRYHPVPWDERKNPDAWAAL